MNYVTRLLAATRYSWQGIQHAIRHEAAFQTELFALPWILGLAFYLGDTPFEIAILIASYLLVMLVELLNSAIEAVVDRIGSERHELSGAAKDLGSAAVFCALLMAIIVWLGILL